MNFVFTATSILFVRSLITRVVAAQVRRPPDPSFMRVGLFALLTLQRPPAVPAQRPDDRPLRDFVSTCRESGRQTLEIVAGATLFAVIADVMYPLRRVGGDR